MPSPETNPNHAQLADAELDANLTRTDITEALRLLHSYRTNRWPGARLSGPGAQQK